MVVYHDRNLIINYIPRNLSDLDLSNLFSTVGPIKTCRIIRDHNSGSSFGFGFCEYEDAESAHRAIERFNGYRIADKILKVSLAKLQGRLYQSSNLYVKNFPLSVTDEEIANNFSRFGTVLQCRILRDRDTNASKGSAYVLFENRVDAENAKRSLDGLPWPGSPEGQPLAIKFATPPYRQPSSNQMKSDQCRTPRTCSSEVGGDEFQLSKMSAAENRSHPNCEIANQYFTDPIYGPPAPSVHATMNTHFGIQPPPTSPSVAWVPEYAPESVGISTLPMAPTYLPPYVFAQTPAFSGFWPALQPNINAQTYGMLYGPQIDGLTNAVHGCPVLTGLPNSFCSNGFQNTAALCRLLSGLLTEDNGLKNLKNDKAEKGNLASVYVYNIGNLMNERRLSELFCRFGTVVNVSIPKDPKTNFTRNFGFVTFSSMHSAQLAINSMNGFVYDGRRLQVSLRKPKNSFAKNSGHPSSKLFPDASDSEGITNDLRASESSVNSETDKKRDETLPIPGSCVETMNAPQLSDVISSQGPISNGCPSGITA